MEPTQISNILWYIVCNGNIIQCKLLKLSWKVSLYVVLIFYVWGYVYINPDTFENYFTVLAFRLHWDAIFFLWKLSIL